MQEYRLVVFTNPAEGLEDQFDEWYVNQHLPDVLKVPGFKAGQRFELERTQLKEGPLPWRFMTIFEIETHDLRGTFDALISRVDTPLMPMSPSLAEQRIAYAFKAVTPRMPAPASGQPERRNQ